MLNKRKSFVISINKTSLRSYLLYLWFFNLLALTVTRFVLSSVGISSGNFREMILWLVASIPLIMCLLNARTIGLYRIAPFLIMFAVVVLAYCMTIMTNPTVAPYLLRENYGLVRLFRPDAAIFAALFFLLPDDTEELKKNITVYALLRFVYEIVFSILPAVQRGYWINVGSSGQEIHLSYSLTFGYNICFPTVVFLYKAIKEKKIVYLLLSLVGVLFIIFYGNRGALLVPLLFLALMLISNILSDRDASKKVLKISAILIGCFLLIIFEDAILRLFLSALTKAGISSRTVNMIGLGTFSEDNGRTRIWLASLDAIKNGGIIGNGMYGDRPFVSQVHYVGYSHNLFLELIASFGIVGAGISVYVIIDSIRMIFFCKDRNWRELYIIFFSISCQLLISMSLWYVWAFWAALAISFNYRHYQKQASLS